MGHGQSRRPESPRQPRDPVATPWPRELHAGIVHGERRRIVVPRPKGASARVRHMLGRRAFLAWAGAAGTAVAPGWAATAMPPPQAEVGKPAPAFDVVDTRGRHQTLAGLAGRTVVLEWTSPTCPFAAAQYESGRMQALQKWARGRGVVWLTVLSSHPSRSDWLEPEAAEVSQAHNYVRAALDDILAGRKVKTATSEPAGCAIAYAG